MWTFLDVYSFNANKIITIGGGMVLPNDEELLDKIELVGVQAKADLLYFIYDETEYNYRMINIQSGLGTVI